MALHNTVRSFFIGTGSRRRKDGRMKANKAMRDMTADELFPRKRYQPEDLCPVIEALAEKTADRFVDMAINLDMKGTMEIISHLMAAQYREDAKMAVTLIKCIFIASGMREAAKDLVLLDQCCSRDVSVYEVFIEVFFETEQMEWFQIENILEKGYAPDSGISEAGGGHEKM